MIPPMSFAQAMQAIRHGSKVWRTSWYPGTGNTLFLQLISGTAAWQLPDGVPTISFGPYTPTSDDILATDWIVLA